MVSFMAKYGRKKCHSVTPPTFHGHYIRFNIALLTPSLSRWLGNKTAKIVLLCPPTAVSDFDFQCLKGKYTECDMNDLCRSTSSMQGIIEAG
jgi:hypothetical protein